MMGSNLMSGVKSTLQKTKGDFAAKKSMIKGMVGDAAQKTATAKKDFASKMPMMPSMPKMPDMASLKTKFPSFTKPAARPFAKSGARPFAEKIAAKKAKIQAMIGDKKKKYATTAE